MWSLQGDLLITFGAPFTLQSVAGGTQAFDPERHDLYAISKCAFVERVLAKGKADASRSAI